jgi:hypothetical protein
MSDTGISVDGPKTLTGALALLLIGLAVTGYGAYDYTQQSNAVDDAVAVDAAITDVGVESTSTGSSPGTDYRPTVRFTYEYDGTEYASTNVFPSSITPNYDTESAAREVVAAYAVGESTTAYVDPADPDGGFLKTETSNAPLVVVGVGLLFVFVGGRSAIR